MKEEIVNEVATIKKYADSDTPESKKAIEEAGRKIAKLGEKGGEIGFSALKNLDKVIPKDSDPKHNADINIDLSKLSETGRSIGSYISKTVKRALETSTGESWSQSKDDFQFDFDLISGKRKNLASALYDTAKDKGIDNEGILYLIHSLPDLESFLYSTSVRKFYRDHTEHQLRVAVLGDFLLEQDLETGSLFSIISEITEIDKEIIKDKIWWSVGLLHDIGYPLEKMTTAVNWSLINQILKCYRTLDIEIVPLELNLNWQSKNQSEYLDILEEGLSKDARILIRKGAGYNFDSVPLPGKHLSISRREGHDEFNFKSPIKLDHGVVGALSLLKSIGTPEEIKQNRDILNGYILGAKAIALHNFKDKLPDFTFDKYPLTFVLTLLDELQEWGRPIPYQVRDSYFNTSLQKISLLDEIILQIDESKWKFEYRNDKAKKMMDFNFKLFCSAKERGFKRLSRGSIFPETLINLQDIDTSQENQERVTEEFKIAI